MVKLLRFSPLLILILSSCAAFEPAVPRVERTWPLPPDPPRIAYVRSFSEPKDLGKRRNWFFMTLRALFGEKESPQMIRPYAIATDNRGRVYVSDTGLQVVHVYDFPRKKYFQIFWIEKDVSRLLSPVGIAINEDGNIYIADSQQNRIFVYRPDGKELIKVIGSEGEFGRVGGLAYNPKNKLIYVVDVGLHQVLSVDQTGELTKAFGGRGGGKGRFNYPSHIAAGPDGRIYVTDSMNFRVQIFDENGDFISTFGRLGVTLGTFSKPKGVAVDLEGHVYVVDGLYDTVQIFDQNGPLLMHFGEAGEGEGSFWLPNGIAIDSRNQIFVADTYNQRVQVFKFLGSPDPKELNIENVTN